MQPVTSYLTVPQFKALPNDNATILAAYTDPQIGAILTRASASANAIMKRNLLARERIDLVSGDDSSTLSLGASPVLYVRQVEFTQPGVSGYILPPSTVLLDARKGIIETYAPLALQGIGYVAVFPRNVQFSVTYATGYGYNPFAPPAWTYAPAPATVGGLTAGPYVLGITTRTAWGETLATIQNVSTTTGALQATITPALGALKYRTFIAPGATAALSAPTTAGGTVLSFATAPGYANGARITLDPMGPLAETVTVISGGGTATLTVTATANAHGTGTLICPELTLIGEAPATLLSPAAITTVVTSAATPAGQYAEVAPLTDASAPPVPDEITEAVQLLALSSIYERNNLANRGVALTMSGRKRTQWRSTEGTSGKGTPTLWQQAEELLAGFKFSGIFGK